MRDSKFTLMIITILFITLLSPQNSSIVSAEESASQEELLLEEGITLVALRNDTLDLNQDGETDAIRVVVMVNTSR